MALKEVTLDLFTEDGRNILSESGTSFLIVERKWIEISSSGGGSTWWIPDPYRYWEREPVEKLPEKLKIVVRLGGREWITEFSVDNSADSIRIIGRFIRMIRAFDDVKVSATMSKYINKVIQVFARKK